MLWNLRIPWRSPGSRRRRGRDAELRRSRVARRRYLATAAGSKESEAANFLEKKVDDLAGYDSDQTVQCAIAALQSVLNADFKAAEIEAMLIKGTDRCHVLTEEEIDGHLNVLAETDA